MMNSSSLPIIALAMLLSVAASAQDSLCSPCVDVPVDIPLEDYRRINSAVPMRGGEVFERVTAPMPPEATSRTWQLRMANPGPFTITVKLGEPNSFPTAFASVFQAAVTHVQSRGYDAARFNARLIVCPEGTCRLDIYPAELGVVNPMTVRECLIGYCATMIYSTQEERVLEIRDWPQE